MLLARRDCNEMYVNPGRAVIESRLMSASRRSFPPASSLRRPLGPRCHGGASSLLRLGFGAAPQRASSPRVSVSDSFDATRVEHVVGWRGRDERGPALPC
jgi:hypothetical protein